MHPKTNLKNSMPMFPSHNGPPLCACVDVHGCVGDREKTQEEETSHPIRH